MTNFERWKRDLTPNKLIYPRREFIALFCAVCPAKYLCGDTRKCKRNFKKWAESEAETMTNKETKDEFEGLAKPLIKFLNDNFNPHTTIIIDTTHGEILSGETAVYTEEYISD